MPKQKSKRTGKAKKTDSGAGSYGSEGKTPGQKRGRDKDGKKIRWTDDRKLQENVLFLSPKASSALQQLQDKRDQLAKLQEEPYQTEHQKTVESNRQKKKEATHRPEEARARQEGARRGGHRRHAHRAELR